MIDFKKSLINLHTKYPEKDLDVLLEILDCIVEIPEFHLSYPEVKPVPNNPLIPEYPNKVWCSSDNKNCI